MLNLLLCIVNIEDDLQFRGKKRTTDLGIIHS